MDNTFEEMHMIESLGIKKHIQIIDGYITTGLDLDDITIHYAVDQRVIAAILHSYGFGLGHLHGDEVDSMKRYKGLPFYMVEGYVTSYFPGLPVKSPLEHINFDSYLDTRHPEWRNLLDTSKSSMFRLSQNELQGNCNYDAKGKKQKTHFLASLQKKMKK